MEIPRKITNEELAILKTAIYNVNRYAKLTQNPTSKKLLYDLKVMTLHKLIELGKAKKTCLNVSANSDKPRPTLLIKVGDFLPHYYHIFPTKEDLLNFRYEPLTDTRKNFDILIQLNKAQKTIQYFLEDTNEIKIEQKKVNASHNNPKRVFVSNYLNGATSKRDYFK